MTDDIGFSPEHIKAYYLAVASGDVQQIQIAQTNLMLDTSNAADIIPNYLALADQGIYVDYGKTVLPKGTILYRIRRYHDGVDFANPKEWAPPPRRPMNRANRTGEEALYLASDEAVCICEMHLMPGNRYVLGRYECIEDIELGGFLYGNPLVSHYDEIGAVLNSFLIAPARGDWNKELFVILDAHYGKLSLDDFCNWNECLKEFAYELPYKFGVLNQRSELHQLTNCICDVLKKATPEGVKYSSCYLPLGTINVDCNLFNCVLYHGGIEHIRWIDSTVKTHTDGAINYLDCCSLMIKTLSKSA